MPGMWSGQNAFNSVLIVSFYPFLFIFWFLPQYMNYEIIAMLVYFAFFFYLKSIIMLRKRDHIDGVTWLDSWTIRDLDYSEELLWGIEDPKPLDYRIGAQARSLEEYVKEAERLLQLNKEKLPPEDKKRWSLNKLKRKDKEIQRKMEEKEREILLLSKTKTKWELTGEYYYLVSLSNEIAFSDTQTHTFKSALFITKFPWNIEFNTGRLQLNVDGYFVRARAAKCALNIEAWLTDQKPLVTVAWTESETLELARRVGKRMKLATPQIIQETTTTKEGQKDQAKEHVPVTEEEEVEDAAENRIRRTIIGLQDLIDHYEMKVERMEITEEKLKRREEMWRNQYEDSEQYLEEIHDDYINSNAHSHKNVMYINKTVIFIAVIIFILVLSALFGVLW